MTNNEPSYLSYLRDQFRDPPNAMFTRDMIENAQRANPDQFFQDMMSGPVGGWTEAANPNQRHQNFHDAGYIYCPYVPLLQTPVVLDPNSFNRREGLITRYGESLLREGARFYSRMVVDGIDDVPLRGSGRYDAPVKVNWAKDGF
jgi:hypothetical protein